MRPWRFASYSAVSASAQQGFRFTARRGEDRAGARGDAHLGAGHHDRRRDGPAELFAQVANLGVGADARCERDELVAGEAGDEAGRSERADEPVRDLDEHLIADRVPEAVVDPLEVVEIQEDDGDGQPLRVEQLLQTA